EWPGFVAWGEATIEVERPTAYFRKGGRCPERITLAISKPSPSPVPSRRSGDWGARVTRAIDQAVHKALQTMAAEGRAFLGRSAVEASSFSRRARAHEEKRGLIPTFAARLREVRDRLRRTEMRFRARYREVLEEWRNGRRDVVFPFGTW